MIPYIGGKSYLASWIINNFPDDYIERVYCEVFGGGGWVLFKKEPSYLEIYNDLNKNLVALFKVIRDHYPEFEHRAQWSLHSREMYEEARRKLADDKFLNQIERAMHYAIGKVQAFSGNGGWGYAVSVDKVYSGKWLPFIKRLSLINARLKKVEIECLDFETVIKKYDSKNVLFYLDPPYYGVEAYYKSAGVDFKREDHTRLAKILKKVKGKFLLSYYEHDAIRSLYKGFNVQTKTASKHSCGTTVAHKIKKKPKAVELLISNY